MRTRPDPPPFVLVGGVPGAGKTTVLRAVAELQPGITVLDSERQRNLLRRYLGRLPYQMWRPLVHLLHDLTLALHLARGATASGGLLVHHNATGTWLRRLLAGVSRARGWRPVLLLLDVEEHEALTGQLTRSRPVRAGAFGRHWRRWEHLRREPPAAGEGWAEVRLADRAGALGQLLAVLDGRAPLGRITVGDAGTGSTESRSSRRS
jgi:hypothetical protein